MELTGKSSGKTKSDIITYTLYRENSKCIRDSNTV